MNDNKAGMVVANMIGAILGFFLRAWLVMLALGELNSADTRIPSYGYWTCVLVMLVIDLVRFSPKEA